MAKPLKIGFIQAKNETDVDWFRPLAFGYLKAYLEKYLDIPAELCFLESLKGFEDFDIVAISSTSQDFAVAKEIACSAKQCKKEIVTILGGHHVTYLPQTLPKEIDIGVMGEGEQTFLELVRFFFNNSLRIKPESIKNIKGIVFRENSTLIITPRRESIIPLDRIPFPYRSAGETSYLFSSRGCPYKCAFCSSSAFWEKTRFFSAEYVVKEMEFLLSQFPKLSHISIWDDLFIAQPTRFREIVELIDERGINRRVSFDLAVRANLVDNGLCDLLKKMNATGAGLGVESGSNRILKILNKGVTVEMNQNAIDTLHRYGIPMGGSFIVGCPTETEEEARSTYEFVLRNIKNGKISPHCAVNILSPMPGTKIWEDVMRAGVIDIENMDWKRLAVFASYRNSNIDNFDQWLRCRRENNSIYLAEDTLPQERLYELMSHYEKTIKELEMGKSGSYLRAPLMISKKAVDRFLPRGTSRRKIARAFYQLLFARNRFKQNVKSDFYLRKQGDLRAMSLKASDLYVNKEPKNQNILDIFANEWSSAMPDDSGLVTKPGKSRLFNDDRIKWVEETLGGFHNLYILELGPLEGGHSYMLQRMGAKKITSIEANTRAFLKCLCIKEIFDLNRIEFKLGDFVSFLKETDVIFDLVIACGVLYHMMNPIELLELISQVTDKVFIWTHYYDREIITTNKVLSLKFGPLEAFEYRGDMYMAAKQSYENALDWLGFCGGAQPTSKWLCRDSIINCLQKLGFSRITIGFDDTSHPNGPAFAICAER